MQTTGGMKTTTKNNGGSKKIAGTSWQLNWFNGN